MATVTVACTVPGGLVVGPFLNTAGILDTVTLNGPPVASVSNLGYGGGGAGLTEVEPAFVAGFDDFAVMGQSVEQRGRHLGVAKDARPFAKGEVGRDDD